MKFVALSFLSLLLGLSLAAGNPLPKEPGSKLTRNEAQHIALRGHQGARVTGAELETIADKKIWVIEIAQGKQRETVHVDAVSGRVVPPAQE